MLQCLALKSSSSAASATSPTFDLQHVPPLSPAGIPMDGTSPLSSTEQSPAVNLTREYTLAVQTNSYNEMWSRIHVSNDQDHILEQIEFHLNNGDGNGRQLILTQVLHPNRDSVEEALLRARPNNLTHLASHYFHHSEDSTYLCLLLRRSVHRARALYDPLQKLLEVLPYDSDCITQSQCDCAYDIFTEFGSSDNPFPCSDSHNFNQMRRCYSQLRHQLDRRLRKSKSRVSLVRRATTGSILCVVGTAVSIALSAVLIATHTIIAFAACPFCTVACLPRNLTKKELAHVEQLNDAARYAYVLDKHLETIDCLVTRLYTAVEDDKELVRSGLGMRGDKHFILGILKLLQQSNVVFSDLLMKFEEHICLCFIALNKARSLLHDEIHGYHISRS